MTITTMPSGATVPPGTETSFGSFHEHSGPYLRWDSWLIIGLLALAQAVDAIMGKTVWDSIAGDAEWISWSMAIGLTVIAALAAFLAGKERGLGHDERARLSTAGWFTLGLVMAALRITEPFLEGQSFDWSDAAMAAAILALYLLAGIGIIYTSSELHQPKRMQLAAAQRKERSVARRLHRAEGEFTRVHDTLAAMDDRKEVLETEYDAALAELKAHEDELKARARLEVAAMLQRPEATSLYREPHWPAEPPAPAAA